LAQAASRCVTTARPIRRASAREPHVTSTTAYSSFVFFGIVFFFGKAVSLLTVCCHHRVFLGAFLE
jgi:hypothetical protein